MLGSLHAQYLILSNKKIDWRKYKAPFGRCFGVPIKNKSHVAILKQEEQQQTAQDLGYE